MDYKQARQLKGKTVQFRTQNGDWRVGTVVKVTKDQVHIEEMITDTQDKSSEGFGFGWGPRFNNGWGRPWGWGPRWGAAAAFDIAAIELVAFPFFFW